MTTRTALAVGLAAVCAAAAIVAAPQIAQATTACVIRNHAVQRVHRPIHRPVAVAAYRETRPARITRTIVETRYVREPAPLIVDEAPIYHERAYYGGYDEVPPRAYERGYYGHPSYHHDHDDDDDDHPVLGIGIGLGESHW